MAAKKKSYKKRGSRMLTRYAPSARALNVGAPGLGRSLKTRLKTCFFYNATAAATGVFTGYLNLGSCFDPCGSLSDIQPAEFDTLKALYARYLVTGATVKITITGTEATGVPDDSFLQWVACAYPSTVTTIPTTFQGAASQPYSKCITFSDDEKATMFFKLNTQKVVGARLPVIAEDCGALIGSSPGTGQNIILPLFVQSNLAIATKTMMLIEIVQDVIFDQRIQIVDG